LFPLSRLGLEALTITALGSILIVGSLVWYEIEAGNSFVAGTADVGLVEEAAYVTLSLIFVGITLVFLGLTRLLKKLSFYSSQAKPSTRMIRLSSAIADGRSQKIFALSAVSYGLLFGFMSSTLVFQPGIAFSDTYGVRVPSSIPVVCCGPFGQMPQLVVYVTQQFAILIVPVNLILMFAVSWLVGLNAATASYVYVNRPKLAARNWLSGMGAFFGLFTVCPTCAGVLLMEVLGLGGVVGLALTLSSLQTVFISISIPILIITPILAMRRVSDLGACSVENAVNNRSSPIT
jgi:hypothetical protein